MKKLGHIAHFTLILPIVGGGVQPIIFHQLPETSLVKMKFHISGLHIVIGGAQGLSSPMYNTSVLLYNVAENFFCPFINLPIGVFSHSAVLLQSNMPAFCGGISNGLAHSGCYQLTNTGGSFKWSQVTNY